MCHTHQINFVCHPLLKQVFEVCVYIKEYITKMEEPIFEGEYSFNTGKVKTFSAVDYVMFGLVLAMSASIGFFFAFKERKKSSMKVGNYKVFFFTIQ